MAERIETPLLLASDCVYDCLCFGCEESGGQIEAQYFCKRCQRYFCENCISLHNQLFKNHVVLGKGEKSEWPLAEAKLDYITQCEHHPEETIKLFCKGHRKLCCVYCLHSDHRLCEEVVRIGEEVGEVDVEKDLRELPENIFAKCEKLTTEHIDMEKQIDTVKASYDETLLEIASFQKKMTDVIEELGQSSTSELNTMFTSINETCNNEIQRHTEINQRYTLLQQGLGSIKQDNKQVAFILCKKYDELSEETESLYERKDNREIHFRFQAEASMLQLLSDLASLGKIQTYKNESNKVIKVSEKTEFTILEDSKTPTIIGICELTDSQLVLADSSNEKVYLLDDSLKVVSHLNLRSKPKKMCNVSAYSVAVLLNDNDIHFIRINDHHMTTERIIQLSDECCGIGCHNNDIFVTTPRYIFHYSIAGKMKTKIQVTRGSACKCAVSPDGTKLYVTTHIVNSCLTLTKTKTLQPSYNQLMLNNPVDVHVTANGQVLVCCRGRGSAEIVQLDREGKEILARFPVSSFLECVCYSKEKGMLLVDGWNRNKIHVFKTI